MPYSTRNGLRIHYEVHGDGPPMVLAHANPFDRRLWLYQVARYSAFFRVIAVDLRGYGLSDKPDTSFTLADMMADVLGVCDDEGVERAVFMGVSVGSGIAMLTALEYPARASAIVLVGGSSNGPRDVESIVRGFESEPLGDYLMRLMRGYVAWFVRHDGATARAEDAHPCGEWRTRQFAGARADHRPAYPRRAARDARQHGPRLCHRGP